MDKAQKQENQAEVKTKRGTFKEKCFTCDKVGHRSMKCRLPKKKNKNHKANVVDNITQDVSDINLSTMVSKMNLVGSNSKEWWIDTGTTRHVCSNKELFTSFELINGEKVFMGNSTCSAVKRK